MCLSAPWLNRTRLLVMNPTISLKFTIQRVHGCSSTERVRRRLMIQPRALRLPLLSRIWTMSKYGKSRCHRCAYRREKHVPTDHEFVTPSEKTQCQVHLTSKKVHRNLPQCSHTKESRAMRHREGSSSGHQPVQGKNEALSGLSGSENAARPALEEYGDHLLAEAKSEVLKQECRADFLDCPIREFQRQTHSKCLEMNGLCKSWV